MHPSALRRQRAKRLAVVAALGLCTHALAQSGADTRSAAGLSRLSIEELAEIEVSSVSKRPERLADAAAALYVITREDIIHSGVTTIAEALRLAPNLHVARVNSNTYAISARGSNSSSSNKLLVMIDGRSVYTPLHSGVFWDVQQVLLNDVERIEIASGPGGTLWGANAVNGVINIITRSAQQTQGSFASVAAGSEERAVGVRHGLQLGPNSYLRLYAKALDVDATHSVSGAELADAWKLNQIGFRSDGSYSASSWTLQGDTYQGSAKAPGADRKVSGGNLLARWNRDLGDGAGLQIQTYLDNYARKQPGLFTEELSTLDIDLQYRLAWGQGHELVWGGGVREQRDHTTGSALLAFVPADSSLRLLNTFVQDTMPLSERVKLTLGVKLEHNNYTGLEVQPNLRVAWKIDERKLLWSAVSRAVRTPSRVDRDFFVFVSLGPPYNGTLNGGSDFVSERLTAYELGYRAQPTPQTSFSVSTYYNDYDRLRSIEADGTGAFVIGNKVLLRETGIEMWGNAQIDESWRVSAGLNWLHQRWRFAAGSTDPGSPTAGGNDPRHKLTLRSSHALPHNMSFDLGLRVVGALPNPAVPSYVALDMRLAWMLRAGIELSLAGFNINDARHVEFGSGPGVSDLRRRFLLRLSCNL